jgi:hypothetical protein
VGFSHKVKKIFLKTNYSNIILPIEFYTSIYAQINFKTINI